LCFFGEKVYQIEKVKQSFSENFIIVLGAAMQKVLIVIAQTDYAFDDDRSKAIESGCNNFIIKPLNSAKLRMLLNFT